MNCNPENRQDYLAAKMLGWRELALYGIDKFERARGHKNFRRLVHDYPDIAAECGMNQHMWSPTYGGSDA